MQKHYDYLIDLAIATKDYKWASKLLKAKDKLLANPKGKTWKKVVRALNKS